MLRAYAAWAAGLGDHAMRALAYMAAVSSDSDPAPSFAGGVPSLSEGAFGRPVPPAGLDRREREAALRVAGRALTELRRAGAISTAARPCYAPGIERNALYRLHLGGASDAERPERGVDDAAGSDAERPEGGVDSAAGSDAERPEGGVDSAAGSDAERPNRPAQPEASDAERPTRDYEREIESLPPVDGSLEAPARRRGPRPDRTPRRKDRPEGRPRPLIPFPVPAAPVAADDHLAATVIEAVRARTGVVITAAQARDVAAGIIGKRRVGSPASYVESAILADPDPRGRFLRPAPGAPLQRPARQAPCPACKDIRRIQDADGNDAGPCPECHPTSKAESAS